MSLEFIPAERLLIHEEEVEPFAERLAAGEVDLLGIHAIVIRELPGAEGYLVGGSASVDGLRQLLENEELEAGTIGQVLRSELLASADALVGDDRPNGAAVVVEGDRITGAWVPTEMTVGPEGDVTRVTDTAGATDTAIRRTPHMKAPKKLRQNKGERFTVRIWTDTSPAKDGEEVEPITIEAPPEIQFLEVGVLLTASQQFQIDSCFKTLRIEREAKDDRPAEFDVMLRDEDLSGEAAIVAQFVYRGRLCGRIRRVWVDGSRKPLSKPVRGASVGMATDEPDLSVFVTAPLKDGINYVCTVQAPKVEGFASPVTEPWALPAMAEKFLAKEFSAFVDRGAPDDERRSALCDAGRKLYSSAPENFKKALWALIDSRKELDQTAPPATIYIASDEPVLPWELMLPTRSLDGLPDDRPLPLGVEFAIGRWIKGDHVPPFQRLEVKTSILIAATNKNPDRRIDASLEQEVLERLFGCSRVPKATRSDLDAYFYEHSGAPALMHFACHGAADAIFLDEDERCSSSFVRNSPGFKAACRQRPFVFLNACDAGRIVASLGGGAGFPPTFGELGARAVIAPVWPVKKTIAAEVASELYEKGMGETHPPLADLLRGIRARSYDTKQPFEDSWAAYTFFGDPNASLLQI